MSALQRRRFWLLARLSIVTTLGGSLYGVIVVWLTEGILSTNAIINGAVTGFTATLLCAGLDLLVLPTRFGARLKRAPFVALVLAKGLWYGGAVVLAMRIGNNVSNVVDPWSWREPRYLVTVALSFGVALLVSLILTVSDHLGHGVLRDLVRGRYHRPREETRVFLFVDMVGSTAIAERIGPIAFLRLHDDFMSDLVEPFLEHDGEVHRYVGDEIIITWPLERGIADANCVRCVLAMHDVLTRRAASYQRRFGMAPRFRAALHAGPVVTGEMGLTRREIVFLGDTVNTTARIEEACRDLAVDILISDQLLARLKLPPGVSVRAVGPVSLRGKAEPMALHALAAASA